MKDSEMGRKRERGEETEQEAAIRSTGLLEVARQIGSERH